MLKSKSIGACLALAFALLMGGGMTTYADTGAANTEAYTESENQEAAGAQETDLASGVIQAGNTSSARKAAREAAQAARAAAESMEAEKNQAAVVEAGASRRGAASEAAQEQTSDQGQDAGQEQKAGNSQEAGQQAADQSQKDAGQSQGAPVTGARSLGMFRTTGYCPCRQCSEGWGRHTCTGAIAQANHTIAVDPRVIPYGSRVMINGVVYTAEDKGGGVKGRHIDIFYDTHAQTRQHGSRNQEVFLLS